MKTCPKCHLNLSLDNFPKSKSKKSGVYSYCKKCCVIRQQEYRLKYKTHIRKYTLQKKKETRDKVWLYFKAHPCTDCGETNPIVLQFDHQKDKEIEVSILICKARPWKRILKEISKCEVVCANCHLKRTAKKFKWYNYS